MCQTSFLRFLSLHHYYPCPLLENPQSFSRIANEVQQGTPAMRKSVLDTLNACKYSVLNQADRANVETLVSTGIAKGI